MEKRLRLLTGLLILFCFSSFQIYSQTVLLVDRDGSDRTDTNISDGTASYTSALNGLGLEYDYWEVLVEDENGPDIYDLEEYDIVIWYCGEVYEAGRTISEEDEENLIEYLDEGGLLFISAQDYLWDRYQNGFTSDNEFPWDYLGLREVTQDVYEIYDPPAQVEGAAGSLAEGFSFEIQDIYSEGRSGLYIDTIIDHEGVDLFNITSPGPGTIAIQFAEDDFRTVFTTGDFAGIVDSVDRVQVMGAIIDWLYDLYAGTPNFNEAKLRVAPNPAKEMVSISSDFKINELNIYNIRGQKVYQKMVNDYRLHIQTDNFKSGVYILEVHADNFVKKEKIIIQ